MRIRLESVGCRLNTGELQALGAALQGRGHRLVGPGEPADLCIVNTCTVTAVAGHRSRQTVRQLRRANPDAVVVATGCLAELEPDSVARSGADHVVGTRDKDHLPDLLIRSGLLPLLPEDRVEDAAKVSLGGHTRAFVKVQDGCDNHCAYCVVRVARGPGRSRDADAVVDELCSLRARGVLEAVLTGVHLGSYGHDRGQREGLASLVERILAETTLPRIRLSSLEPWDVGDRLLGLFSDRRLLPHLHLPLQSGCDATLGRMARKCSQADFTRLVNTARRLIPGVSVSTDVMVGFPGETDAEFAESVGFVERMAFSRIHVFRFSPRTGTPAATMPNPPSSTTVAARAARVREVARRHQEEFHRRFLGRTVEVLWEGSDRVGSARRWSGLTPNYIRVIFETDAPHDLANRVIATELLALVPGGLAGRPAPTPDHVPPDTR